MFIICLLTGYFLGSIPTGKVVGIVKGIDIQKAGSGNIGFANSVRVLGWKSGVIVLIGDVAKGFIPILLCKGSLTLQQTFVVGIMAILGHLFPVWLRFRGGKGIATGFGIFLALSPVVGLLGLLVYLAGFIFFRKSGPSSVLAAWSLVVFSLLISPHLQYFALLSSIIATWTHRDYLKVKRTIAK